MTVEISLGEVHSLALKAARGAGRSHGMAEEAAFATRWLIMRGFDGAENLAALLRITDVTLQGCPLALGTVISDTGVVPSAAVGPVHVPLLLAPFLEPLCPPGQGLALRSGAATMRIGAGNALDGPALPLDPTMVQIEPCVPPALSRPSRRAILHTDTLNQLNAFAARTYAPATEESRAKGAGAGGPDGD